MNGVKWFEEVGPKESWHDPSKAGFKAKAEKQDRAGFRTQAAPAADIPARHVEPSHEFTLSEEEVSDVSLATFYVFDKERAAPPAFTLARACGRCGGCARCAAGRCAAGRCAVGRCAVGRCVVGRFAVGACTGCGGGCGTGYCYSTGGCNVC